MAPSVVRIESQGASAGGSAQQLQVGVGTGVIIDSQGHIVTNNHVITLDTGTPSSNITVAFSGGKTVPAQIAGRDAATDLAVLTADTSTADVHPATFGNASSLVVGETVVGYALDLPGTPSVTRGVLSALSRSIQEQQTTISPAVQTDASINPGNSGGPLVDATGDVIGINTAVVQNAQNIGFAISVALVQPVVKQLIQSGDVTRAFLGITPVDVTPALASQLNLPVQSGVGIVSVQSGSPAANAGLQADDIIVSIGGTTVANSGDLLNYLSQHEAGEPLSVDYYRGGSKQTVQVTLGRSPAA
jgi:S1-C subfamily serine protease